MTEATTPEQTLQILRNFVSQHTQSNVDRMSEADLHVAIDDLWNMPKPAFELPIESIEMLAFAWKHVRHCPICFHWQDDKPQHAENCPAELARKYLARINEGGTS